MNNRSPIRQLPAYVLLGGKKCQLRERIRDDLTEYRVGIISLITDDPCEEPTEEGQTNFLPYLNCEYALFDGVWFLFYRRRWVRCEADIAQEYVRFNGRLMMLREKTDKNYSDCVTGTISSCTKSAIMIPEKDEQTNFGRLLGCEYAIVMEEYYLHHPLGAWYHLEAVLQSEEVMIRQKAVEEEKRAKNAYDRWRKEYSR